MPLFGDSESFLSMLKNIHAFPIPVDFSFYVGNHSFKIYKLFACMLSPAVLHALQGDATIEEYQIDFNGNKKVFDQILNIFSGIPFEITAENSFDVYKIASQLQNEELIDKSTHSMFSTLTNANIFQKFNLAFKLSIPLAPFIEYISSNFQELSSNEALFNLPIDIIVEILKNPKLSIPDYSWLIKWIENVIEERGSQYSVLIESIKFANMEPSDIYHVLQMASSASLTSEICFKIKTLFMDILKSMSLTVEYKNQNDNLHGIIDHLTAKYGNVVEERLVNVLVPCNNSMACDLLNYTNRLKSHWKNESLQEQNWIIFDFKSYTLKLTAYTIRGCYCQDYNCRPKSWTISGSNDQKKWTILSEIRNCTSIDRPYGMMTFEVPNKTQSFRFIKYTQLENNEKNLHYIVHLSAIEFFGTISSFKINNIGV